MRRKKLTPTQGKLIKILSNYISENKDSALSFDTLKNLCYPFPSFDNTFNSILFKNHLIRVEGTNNYYLR